MSIRITDVHSKIRENKKTHEKHRTNTKETRRQTCDSHSNIRKRKNTHEKSRNSSKSQDKH